MKLGRRPDSGPEKKGAVIYIYWVDTLCRVYLDSSGESLQKRGYRKMPFMAPLQETLAAAIVMATRWDCRGNFINPMCGSGTIAIEAALMALNRAPGLLRGNFGFMHVKGLSPGGLAGAARPDEGRIRKVFSRQDYRYRYRPQGHRSFVPQCQDRRGRPPHRIRGRRFPQNTRARGRRGHRHEPRVRGADGGKEAA